MWNPPTKKMLQRVPKLYAQENVKPLQKKVYLKFFLGGWTWYVTEISHENWDTMFGVVFSPMTPEGEWGYSSLKELKAIRVKPGFEVDRDIHSVSPYEPKKLGELLRSDGRRMQ
jgi:hypothetical protein